MPSEEMQKKIDEFKKNNIDDEKAKEIRNILMDYYIKQDHIEISHKEMLYGKDEEPEYGSVEDIKRREEMCLIGKSNRAAYVAAHKPTLPDNIIIGGFCGDWEEFDKLENEEYDKIIFGFWNHPQILGKDVEMEPEVNDKNPILCNLTEKIRNSIKFIINIFI